MQRNHYVTVLVLFLFSVPAISTAFAENTVPECVQLDAKASGDLAKYSLHGEANGPIFFSGISCAIKHRNKELCAMEMVSFDSTAKVFDHNTGEEIDVGKAYFWLDGKNRETPTLAFGSKEGAEKFAAGTEGGEILDYTGLTDR